MKIIMISWKPSFCNAYEMVQALSLSGDVHSYFHVRDSKGFDKNIHQRKYSLKRIPDDGDCYVVVTSRAFEYMTKHHHRLIWQKKKEGKVKVILSDGYYIAHHERINPMLKGVEVYAMPDKSRYCLMEHKEFYPPFETNLEAEKEREVKVSHSPNTKIKMKRKGSDFILNKLNKEGIPVKNITGMRWRQSLLQKSKTHIFIDQIASHPFIEDYKGGLGKSGVEAMALGCLTMTGGDLSTGNPIPTPPVIRINKDNFVEKLLSMYVNNTKREQAIEKQKQWVSEYCSYEYVNNLIMKTK